MMAKFREPWTPTRLKFYAGLVAIIFGAGVAYAVDQARDVSACEKIEANGANILKLEAKVDSNEVKRQGDHDLVVEIKNDVKWIRESLEKTK